MSMSTIIIGVLFIVVFGIIIKYYTGKKKLPSNRSNTEKLANTLHTKFDKFIKDLNNGLRTPEIIQEEMLETLDDFKYQKLSVIKTTAENLVKNYNSIESNKLNLEKSRDAYSQKVNESKRAIKITDDENDKAILIEQGAHAMQQVDIINKSIETTENSMKTLKLQIDKLHNYTTSYISKIEMKRTEILTMISTYIASDNNIDMDVDFTIDDLMTDYKTQMDVKVENNKIDAIAHSFTADPIQTTASEDYIEKFKEELN